MISPLLCHLPTETKDILVSVSVHKSPLLYKFPWFGFGRRLIGGDCSSPNPMIQVETIRLRVFDDPFTTPQTHELMVTLFAALKGVEPIQSNRPRHVAQRPMLQCANENCAAAIVPILPGGGLFPAGSWWRRDRVDQAAPLREFTLLPFYEKWPGMTEVVSHRSAGGTVHSPGRRIRTWRFEWRAVRPLSIGWFHVVVTHSSDNAGVQVEWIGGPH